MITKNKFLLTFALFALLFAACGSDSDSPSPTPDPTPSDGDVADKVSQYEARAFDGEKRGGVFYEIFVRSFADSDADGTGDLNGVTAKLDYLNDLGVSGIWLMPIFTTTSYHGYDVIDFTKVNPEYGTAADFKKLISEAHKRKIRVILDFVPNHTSDKCAWFTSACASTDNTYRDYYHFSTTSAGGWYQVPSGTTTYYYQGAFDRSMPDLNYGAASTCETSGAFRAMTDAAKYWIDNGVDGFRLDAVKHIYDNEKSSENPTFLNKFYTTLDTYYQSKRLGLDNNIYMVGECWLGYKDVAQYYKGLPALFEFDGWSSYLSYAIQNSHAKWYPKDILAERAVYAAQRADFIQATKLSNHDEDRARTTLGGSLAVSRERAKIAAAVLLTSIGSPYIYYGEEIGMLGSKSTGDNNVREPMLWSAKASDAYRPTTYPQSNNSTDTSVGNVDEQSKSSQSIYSVYKKFLRLRNTYPALASGTMSLPKSFNDSDNTNKQVMAFVREAGSERLLILHNVSATTTNYTIDYGVDKAIADMNGVTYRKNGSASVTVTMPAYSSIIFQL